MAIENLAMDAVMMGVLVISLIAVLGIIAAAFYFYNQYKKYREYKCVILTLEGGIKYDFAGIFIDKKTNVKRLFLKKANSSLDPNNVPYKISDKGEKTIFLFQTGLKNFSYINVDLDVDKDGILPTVTVGEEDINWGINSYERAKKIFSGHWLLPYLPFIALAFTSIIILLIFIYFFKEFKSLKEFAIVMKEVAEIMRQARSGTTII